MIPCRLRLRRVWTEVFAEEEDIGYGIGVVAFDLYKSQRLIEVISGGHGGRDSIEVHGVESGCGCVVDGRRNEGAAETKAAERSADPEPLHLAGLHFFLVVSAVCSAWSDDFEGDAACGLLIDEGEQKGIVAAGQAFELGCEVLKADPGCAFGAGAEMVCVGLEQAAECVHVGCPGCFAD